MLSVRIDLKEFPQSDVPVLKTLLFHAEEGEFVSLLGPSGCGKSTLLRIIAGLDVDYSGEVRLRGDLVARPGSDRGIVFQDSRLLGWRTVAENVRFALPRGLPAADQLQRINRSLELVKLTDVRNAWPHQLSGGMQKRLAFARAIVNLPDLLLLDEPFSALDSFSKFALQSLAEHIHKSEGITTILVTHDIDEAVYLSDKIAILTPRPAAVMEILHLSLPRPRDRTSREYAELRSAVLSKVLYL